MSSINPSYHPLHPSGPSLVYLSARIVCHKSPKNGALVLSSGIKETTVVGLTDLNVNVDA